MLVCGCEVPVEAALELSGPCGRIGRRRLASGYRVVELPAVDVDDGVDVVGRLHPALELQRVGTGGEELGKHRRGVGVARAERPVATGGGERTAPLVDELVG